MKSVAKTEPASALGWRVLVLAALVTSYFYTLPLGRYSAFGFQTDLRVYDPLSFLVLTVIALPERHRLIWLWSHKAGFWRWSAILIVFVWLSLGITAATGGMSALAPAIIRAFRFTVYLLTGSLVALYANTPRRYRFLLYVLVANILLQAIIGFLQGIGLAPHLWPDYWLTNYGRLPVATLSPHHKHIAVVMLLGVAVCVALARHYRSLILQAGLGAGAFIMILVPVFGGTRTFVLGIAGLVFGYVLQQRTGGVARVTLMTGVLALGLYVSWDEVNAPIREQLDQRVLRPIENRGYEGLYGARTRIYFDDLPKAAAKSPWILISGTGFQNIKTFTRANGAHNNYLHVLFELGIVGFFVYMRFLARTLNTLRMVREWTEDSLAKSVADGAWVAFVAVMVTMLVGESLWAQYSMFTLSGQILALVGIASAPLLWATPAGPAPPRRPGA